MAKEIKAIVETNKGTITINLFPQQAPITVSNLQNSIEGFESPHIPNNMQEAEIITRQSQEHIFCGPCQMLHLI